MPSSVVAAMKYNQIKGVLRIIFVSGNIYDYKNVPEAVYKEMKSASSKGTYLNQHIKNRYRYTKIN